MTTAPDDDAIISAFLSRVLEDRAEFTPREDRKMPAPNADLPVKLLQTGRWDYAFDIVWTATVGIPEFQDDEALPSRRQAVTVRNSQNHALGREFAGKMALLAQRKKQMPLSVAWMMLAADASKPASIAVFLPRLLQIVLDSPYWIALDGNERAAIEKALEVWVDASTGLHVDAELSMFTLQHTGQSEKARRLVAAKSVFRQVVSEPETPEFEPDVPGIVVMQSGPVGKLQPENQAYSALIKKWMPFVLAPDLEPIKATLLAEYPHAESAIDLLMRDLRAGQPIRINPVVLVGPPGNGKSRLVRRFAELLRVGMTRFDASSASDSLGFSGVARGWGSSVPSMPARAIREFDIPNPFIMIDEIEKAGTSHHNGNFLSALTTFLERETSARMRDSSLDVAMDFSWISYLATANADAGLPAQIKDRFRVITMPAPTLKHLPALARNVQVEMALEAGDDIEWIEPLADDELEVAGAAWAKARFSLRALQKIVNATVEARTRFPGMRH
jgi:ATP-dependent Lon protease